MDVSLAAATDQIAPGRGYFADVWRRLIKSRGALIGLGLIGVLIVTAAFAPLIAHTDPLAQNLAQQSLHPSLAHPFGTDKLGRDLFSRIIYGSRISIRIGFLAVGIAITIGTLFGVAGGYLGKATD